MEVTQVSKEGELHTLDIELSPDEVNQEFSRAFNRYRKSLVVPGFRRGKAPRGAVMRKFGSKIQQEVRDTLLSAYSLLATDMRNMNLIDRPKVETLGSLEQNKPFSFRIEVQASVMPEVRGYDELRIELPPRRVVTEDDMNEAMDRLRKRYATLKPAEGPDAEVCVTDWITVDAAFLGRENDEVLISAPDEFLEVASAETMLFGLKLVGRKLDDEIMDDYIIPDDFPDEKLRGYQVRARIKIREIKKIELPPLDGSFAEMTGECSTLSELKELLSSRMQAQYDEVNEGTKEQAMFDKLLENYPIEVHPEVLKDRIFHSLRNMAQRGMMKEGASEEEIGKLMNAISPVVLNSIKREMLLGQIALQEGISATSDELTQAMKDANLRPSSDPSTKEYLIELTKLRQDVRKHLTERKARLFLLDRLEIEYASDSADEDEQPEQSSSEEHAE